MWIDHEDGNTIVGNTVKPNSWILINGCITGPSHTMLIFDYSSLHKIRKIEYYLYLFTRDFVFVFKYLICRCLKFHKYTQTYINLCLFVVIIIYYIFIFTYSAIHISILPFKVEHCNRFYFRLKLWIRTRKGAKRTCHVLQFIYFWVWTAIVSSTRLELLKYKLLDLITTTTMVIMMLLLTTKMNSFAVFEYQCQYQHQYHLQYYCNNIVNLNKRKTQLNWFL